jgi:hypothetical protein
VVYKSNRHQTVAVLYTENVRATVSGDFDEIVDLAIIITKGADAGAFHDKVWQRQVDHTAGRPSRYLVKSYARYRITVYELWY